MFTQNIPATALTLALGAFSLGLVPATANAVTTGSPTFTSQTSPVVQVAYVKKKVVIKKKGVKKTTVVVRHRPRGYAYGFYAHRPYHCKSVIRYVKDRHHHMVRVVRRSC
jgi:hypothetical protein